MDFTSPLNIPLQTMPSRTPYLSLTFSPCPASTPTVPSLPPYTSTCTSKTITSLPPAYTGQDANTSSRTPTAPQPPPPPPPASSAGEAQVQAPKPTTHSAAISPRDLEAATGMRGVAMPGETRRKIMCFAVYVVFGLAWMGALWVVVKLLQL
ncbi:hypothetical protein COCMIDRAFT_98095 [Bipolaris oryzae ATCC 44560]|uniref:Uncharacterized protein n=1 Tax=Bipolaris oryzae ATCC 44560 TaxID=930090 RepID=W6Z3F3_COCMI|nr:uncharacterized protein COCMIDRAFT_98095 [Bipolaris oryzae ATCC 44560]EUC44500.1 hypothetical protein COCMIDRAFT_98095 [Bipolaris oryzae ATCC 44560]